MGAIKNKLQGMFGGSRVVAVDFDARRLRLVESSRAAGVAVVRRLHCADMPDDVDINDATAVGRFIALTLREAHITGAALLMNVSRSQAVLKPLSFPPGTDEADLPGMVLYQMESELPFAVADSVIDFTVETHYGADPSGGESESVDVLVSAVRLGILDYYKRVASAAGAKLIGLGLRPYSNLRCVQSCLPVSEGEGASVALVNLTADETEIDVFIGGPRKRLAFSRSVALAVGDDDARVRAVVTEAGRSLRSFQTLDSGGRIDSLLVAGSSDLETEVADALGRRLGIPGERFDPSEAMGLTGGADASGFVAALGLAAAGDAGPLNFLSPKRPPVQRNKRKAVTIGAVACAAVLLASLVTVAAMDLSAAHGELREINEQIKENEPTVTAVQKLSKRVDQIDAWQSGGRDWLRHWAHVSCLLPSCTELYVTSVRSGADGRMGLEVRARQSEVIDRLRRRITDAGYEFHSSGVSTTDDEHGYNYAAMVHVRIPAGMEVDLSQVQPVPRPADDMAAGRAR